MGHWDSETVTPGREMRRQGKIPTFPAGLPPGPGVVHLSSLSDSNHSHLTSPHLSQAADQEGQKWQIFTIYIDCPASSKRDLFGLFTTLKRNCLSLPSVLKPLIENKVFKWN